MSELSSTTRALLRAAKSDGPGSAARAAIWHGVASRAGGGVGGGAGTSAGGAAGIGTAKLLVMGALLGSTITVGLAAFALRIAVPRLHADVTDAVHADNEMASIAPPTRAGDQLSAGTPAPAAQPAASHARIRPRTGDTDSRSDSLDREATLVAEARGALVRGEPQAALSAVHAAQALAAHGLQPEELSVESRALRALGRTQEASAVEEKLRTRFPDNALGR